MEARWKLGGKFTRSLYFSAPSAGRGGSHCVDGARPRVRSPLQVAGDTPTALPYVFPKLLDEGVNEVRLLNGK